MAILYKGEKRKFEILLTAPGFSMDTDDFEIEVKSPKTSVKASKSFPNEDLNIFREDSDSSSSGEDEGTWYAIVNTAKLSLGDLKVVATALVNDSHASGNVRPQIDVKPLGTLKNP